MAAERDDSKKAQGNRLEELLCEARERYREENGEEPSEEYLEELRKEILRGLAKKGRDEHRDVYDALAEE